MMFLVSCEGCACLLGYTPRSEFRDEVGAQKFVRRHNALTGHHAAIQPMEAA